MKFHSAHSHFPFRHKGRSFIMSPQRRSSECQGKRMEQSYGKVDSSLGLAGCSLCDPGQVTLPLWGTFIYIYGDTDQDTIWILIKRSIQVLCSHQSLWIFTQKGLLAAMMKGRARDDWPSSPLELCQVFCFEKLKGKALPTRFFSPTLCLPQRPLLPVIFSSSQS